MKRFLAFISCAIVLVSVKAQNATNSPYSQYGYGTLADQVNGAAVGMSGVSQGWREGNSVNFGNPASYSAIDSLTFIFDAGISGIMTNFTENERRKNANNTSFDYLVGAFRLLPRVGFAFGFMPYSNVGYSYSNEETLDESTTSSDTKTTSTATYSGSGGIHQLFIGVGVAVIKSKGTNISIGANASYLWGNYTREVYDEFSETAAKTTTKYYQSSVNSYKVDASLQWQQRVGRDEKFTLGGTYSFGHKMNSNPRCSIISYESQTGLSDTTSMRALRDLNDPDSYAKLALPTSIAVGLVWNHANQLRIGADWKYELWSKIDYPMYETETDAYGINESHYVMKSGQFKDRMKYVLGAEYVFNEVSRRWVHRLRYRIGVSYTTPYLRIEEQDQNGNAVKSNGQTVLRDGPREYSVSAGIGIPIINAYNNRSILNISASWTRTEAKGLIKENTFRINIGLTFNERWFAKWQVE